MEQAKKRDHKIFVTDIAIDKVPYISVKGLPIKLCKIIQKEHKEILRISQTENESNEILTIMTVDGKHMVRIHGDEFEVDPSENVEAISLFTRAQPKELMYLHNHPSLNIFSMADIDTFVCESKIVLLSVVTNQGNVYILYKNERYDYTLTRKFLIYLYKKYNGASEKMINTFLKQSERVGITYEKSK